MYKKNCLFNIKNIKNEEISVYIGSSAGKQLMQNIKDAKEEILIISPYVSEKKISQLIELKKKNRNLNIRLGFFDEEIVYNKEKQNILRRLIYKKQIVDKKTKEYVIKKVKWYSVLSKFMLIILFLLIFFIVLRFIFYNQYFIDLLDDIFAVPKWLRSNPLNIDYLGILITCFIINKIILNKMEKIKKTPIYSYEYFENKYINFKYFKIKNMFIHSKIYIIDRKIAYLGSMNFTNKALGFNCVDNDYGTNFEIRVRISGTDKIKDLVNFVNDMLDDDYNYKKYSIEGLGKQIYSESKYSLYL